MKTISKLPTWLTRGLILPLIVLNGWLILLVFKYFESLITVFVAATLLSFLLDYPVKQLEKWRFNRIGAILTVLLVVIVLFGILGITLIPTILEQSNALIERLPSWLDSGNQQIQSFQVWASQRNFPVSLSNVAAEVLGRLSNQLQQISGQILGSIFSAVGGVLDLFLTLILTFYLLLHGEELWTDLFQLFPTTLGKEIRLSLRQTFHNYFIGQATLAATMGLSMTVAFFLVQAPFWLLFGVSVGIMAFFPFGAALSIGVVTFLVALKSIWLGVRVLMVAVVIDQVVESGIAPRLLGGFTGLNPVLVLLSLLTGAKIAGFLGLIVAVPITGFIKSLFNIFASNAQSSIVMEQEVATFSPDA